MLARFYKFSDKHLHYITGKSEMHYIPKLPLISHLRCKNEISRQIFYYTMGLLIDFLSQKQYVICSQLLIYFCF